MHPENPENQGSSNKNIENYFLPRSLRSQKKSLPSVVAFRCEYEWERLILFCLFVTCPGLQPRREGKKWWKRDGNINCKNIQEAQMFLKSHPERILRQVTQRWRIHNKHRKASVCDCLHRAGAESEESEYRALARDICSSIYASEDTERYLLKHMLRKNSPVPESIAQLSNTLEHVPPTLPRSESKILTSSFDHSVTYIGICQGTCSESSPAGLLYLSGLFSSAVCRYNCVDRQKQLQSLPMMIWKI